MSLHEKDWERAQKLGLTSKIKTVDDYNDHLEQGKKNAKKYFSRLNTYAPTNQEIKNIHKITFDNIHPWAGQFREPGQEVRVGDIKGSLAMDVPEELKRLHDQMLSKSLDNSKELRAKQIASYHAIYESIHPFQDGNGRTGRIIMDGQAKKLLGKKIEFNKIDKIDYYQALQAATSYGKIDFLANIVQKNSLDIKKPDIADLKLKEKRLVKARKALGFKGSDLAATYGLGGYPPAITIQKAERIAKRDKTTDLPHNKKVFKVLKENQALIFKQQRVQKELRTVREHIQDFSKKLDQGKRLEKKQSIKLGKGRSK